MRHAILLVALFALGSAGGAVVHDPLFVGSFNIQDLTDKKFRRPQVMDVVEKVILRYDLILIMEIMAKNDVQMNELLEDINAVTDPDKNYGMTIGDRRFNGTREHYAFLFRKDKLRLIESESYADESAFYRKPLVAIFEAFTLRDMNRFAAVGHHVKPDAAVREINALADVYDYIKWEHGIEDVLLMGDFNADCTYVKESDWEHIALWHRAEFTWAIPPHYDTTTNYKSCALDRFVYAGEKMNNGVIPSSAGAFRFQEEYGLSIQEVRDISDHWPIELKIRGRVSELAEKHLTTEVCFRVHDTQPRNNSTKGNVAKLARKCYFDVRNLTSGNGILLTNITREEADMLDALERLRIKVPTVVTQELVAAVKYKVDHGALNDDSSFADNYDFKYTIDILARNKSISASVCRMTSIN